ncbi:hypothetical protein CsSME_00041604 [Camellia sinensis var. sinensis]
MFFPYNSLQASSNLLHVMVFSLFLFPLSKPSMRLMHFSLMFLFPHQSMQLEFLQKNTTPKNSKLLPSIVALIYIILRIFMVNYFVVWARFSTTYSQFSLCGFVGTCSPRSC